MLKQPDQDLRFVSEGEKSPGLNAAWVDLGKRSADDAPASAQELVMPFLGNAHVAGVYAQDQMLLAVPLEHHRLFDQSHGSPITNCGTCRADRLHGQAAVSFLLEKRGRPILLRAIPVQSQFFGMIESAATYKTVLQSWQRACLEVTGHFEDWLEGSFDARRRKEFRRLRNRLSEQGDLQILRLGKGAEANSFIDGFLKLEAAGWKGESGTALANHPGYAAATVEALTALHVAGKLRFWTMTLNGKPIASLFAFVEGSKASLGKIAYDEAFGKYSPGVLLILDATADFFKDGTIREVDSSAIPNHPMIDHIWRGRIALADILVAPASVSALRFRSVVMTEKIRRMFRAALKAVYYKLTGKSRS
jgi:CelD/BcsL family acetyltransferase involved in cellulose biosynthesis